MKYPYITHSHTLFLSFLLGGSKQMGRLYLSENDEMISIISLACLTHPTLIVQMWNVNMFHRYICQKTSKVWTMSRVLDMEHVPYKSSWMKNASLYIYLSAMLLIVVVITQLNAHWASESLTSTHCWNYTSLFSLLTLIPAQSLGTGHRESSSFWI